jgi:hypothetical protein
MLIWLRVFVSAVAALVVAFRFLPIPPHFPSVALDASWESAAHYAAVHRLAWGRELVFTTGPLGFLFTGMFWPQTYPLLLGYWTFWAMVTVVSALRLHWRVDSCWVYGAGFAVIYALVVGGGRESILVGALVIIAANLLADRERASFAFLVLAGISLAALSMTKFSFMMLAGAILALYGVRQVLERASSRAIALSGVFAASFLALWYLTGQDLADLVPFLRISLAIAGGYGPAMSILGNDMEMLLYLVGTAGLLSGLWIARRGTLTRQGGVEIAGVAVLAFGLFKLGFQRHDVWHTYVATSGLLAIALVYASTGLLSTTDVPIGARASYTLAVVAGCAGLALLPYPLMPSPSTLRERISAFLQPAALLERYASQFTAANQAIANAAPFCDLVGPTDVISYRQQVVFSNGLQWRPRPIFQSYAAYTPELLRLNAASYEGPMAPENVLLQLETIDNRFPSLDDSLLWPLLLTRYDIVDTLAAGRLQYLVLRRAMRPRPYTLTLLEQKIGTLGEALPVPRGGTGLVWVTIDVEPTLIGRLMSFLYKLPELAMEVTTDRNSRVYRLVPDMAHAGFLLSPIVEDAVGFATLVSEERAALMTWSGVRRLRVFSPNRSELYSRSVRISFLELALPTYLSRAQLGQFTFPVASQPPRSVAARFPVRPMAGPQDEPVMFVHAPSKMIFDPRASVERVHVNFGLIDKAWQEGQTDGVEFRASIQTERGNTLLWSRFVDPIRTAADRGILTATIMVPNRLRGQPIVMETLPGPRGDVFWDWSFWSRIDLLARGGPATASTKRAVACPRAEGGS